MRRLDLIGAEDQLRHRSTSFNAGVQVGEAIASEPIPFKIEAPVDNAVAIDESSTKYGRPQR